MLNASRYAQIISAIACNGIAGDTGEGAVATAAEIYAPQGVAINGSRNVYIGYVKDVRIRKITTAGIIRTIAGSGRSDYFPG